MPEAPLTAPSRQSSLAPILPHLPLLSSVEAGWHGILLEFFRYPPFETPEYSHADHKIAIHTHIPPNLQVKRRLDGRVQYEQVLAQQAIVVPAKVSHQVQWDQTAEFLILTLKPDMLSQVAHDAIPPDRVELAPCSPKPDPLIHQLGLALKEELALNQGRDRLYVESLTNCLAVHLLKKYSVKPITSPNLDSTQGLPQSKLNQVIAYIHDHLGQEIKLVDLAMLVGMSACYFAWRFKQSMGISPHQFVVQCRLERSQQLLKQTQQSIAEIALQCGFSSQSHLTRSFRKHFNTTPRAYRTVVQS